MGVGDFDYKSSNTFPWGYSLEIEYVYVMPVGGLWQTRVPGRAEASKSGTAAEAIEVGRDFAWLRQCVGGVPVHLRIRQDDGTWVEVEATESSDYSTD